MSTEHRSKEHLWKEMAPSKILKFLTFCPPHSQLQQPHRLHFGVFFFTSSLAFKLILKLSSKVKGSRFDIQCHSPLQHVKML